MAAVATSNLAQTAKRLVIINTVITVNDPNPAQTSRAPNTATNVPLNDATNAKIFATPNPVFFLSTVCGQMPYKNDGARQRSR